MISLQAATFSEVLNNYCLPTAIMSTLLRHHLEAAQIRFPDFGRIFAFCKRTIMMRPWNSFKFQEKNQSRSTILVECS